MLLYEPGGNNRRVIADWFRQAGIAPRPVMALGDGSLPAHSLTPRLDREIGLVVRRDKIPERGLRELMRSLRALRGPEAQSASIR